MKMSKTEKMRQIYLSDTHISYLCDFYSCELQPVDVELQRQISEMSSILGQKKEVDLTPKPGMYSENFSNKLTKQMIVDGVNKLFDEHGRFCISQGEISRENFKAWFAMIYPEIYPYDEMEYAIGWNNKKLKAKRVEVEKVWKQNATEKVADYWKNNLVD